MSYSPDKDLRAIPGMGVRFYTLINYETKALVEVLT